MTLALAGTAGAGSSDAPIPAPGQGLPAHAAGGWPTETTGDDKVPKRTPEQQANLDAVSAELKRIGKEYGPDAVVLQAKLMMKALAAGALGPTEVRVAGPSTGGDPSCLEIDVETGLYFDERATTADSRVDTVWRDIAAPVLEEMVSFHIEPSGLELVFLFDVQDTALQADGQLSVTAAARHEEFRIRMERAMLEEIMADRLTGDALRSAAVFTPVTVVASQEIRQGEPAHAPKDP